MKLLFLFESIRTPVLDKFFYGITFIADEIVFMILALMVFWCISKKTGYYMMAVCFFGIISNQIIKIVFRVPRPYVRDPSLSIVETARKTAGGYSFPSGHTQNSFGFFGCAALTARKKLLRVLFAAFPFLVGLSRMYLGVHTPADVVSAALVAILFVAVFYFAVYKNQTDKTVLIALFCMLAFSAAFLVFMFVYDFSFVTEYANITDAQKNACMFFGCILGMICAYPIEKKYINFKERSCFTVQVLKLVLGCAVIFLIRALTKSALNAALGINLSSAVRYFIIVFFAVGIWPFTFSFFDRLITDKKSCKRS